MRTLRAWGVIIYEINEEPVPVKVFPDFDGISEWIKKNGSPEKQFAIGSTSIITYYFLKPLLWIKKCDNKKI